MKYAGMKDVVESFIADAGNVQEGQKRFSNLVEEGLEKGEFKPSDFSLKQLFEVLCNRDGKVDRDSIAQVYEAVHSSAFPYVTGKLISKMVLDKYEYSLGDAKELVTEYKMSRDTEDIAGFTDLDLPDEVGEGMPYTETTLDEKRVTLRANKGGRIISLTKELIMFDQTGKLLDRASMIGETMGYVENKTVFQRISDIATTFGGYGANTSLEYGGSTRTFYSSDHSSWDVNANDNGSLTNTLGTAGLKAAFDLLARMKNRNGEYVTVTPTHLIVSPLKYWDALELLGSDRQFDSAENAVNVFKGKLKVVQSPILADTSSYYWYLGDFKKDFVIGRVWDTMVEQQTTSSESAFTADVIQRYKVSSYFGVNARDYRHSCKVSATA